MKTYQRGTHGALFATLLTLAVPTKGPNAKELLHHAASNFAATHTFHFTFSAHPVTPGFHLPSIAGGDGTVWPDRLVFSGTMQSTPVLAAAFTMATCGPDQYAEMGDGEFQKMQDLPDARRLLFAPDSGLVAGILTQLEHASTPQATALDTVAMWRLAGTLPSRLLATLPGHAAPSGAIRAALWIGQRDQRLHQVTLEGAMFSGDSAQMTRTLTFSRFNEQIPLTVPRGHAPCDSHP